jgi:hypothetical protein
LFTAPSFRFLQLLLACGVSLVFPLRGIRAQTPAQGHTSSWYNPDSSNKLALEFGGGYDPAIGVTNKSQQNGWNFTMGGGYNLNRRVGVLLEYSYAHASTPSAFLYDTFPSVQPFPGNVGGTGAVHIWSITAEPVYHFWNGEKNGAYVLGGGGFYRKHTILRGGSSLQGCDDDYPTPCYVDTVDLSNNAGGLNAGIGIAHRMGTYDNAKLFLEARYVWVDNKPSPDNTLYAPANQRTSYIPLVAGVRW